MSKQSKPHSHKPGEECAVCSEGIEAVLAREAEWMEKHGWYCHVVGDDSDSPTGFNYHTHGMRESFDHPDIQCVLPMNPQVIHSVVHTIAAKIKEGQKFVVGKRYPNIVGNGFDVLFANAEECDRPVLRLMIPDKHNKFDPTVVEGVFRDQWGGVFPEGEAIES